MVQASRLLGAAETAAPQTDRTAHAHSHGARRLRMDLMTQTVVLAMPTSPGCRSQSHHHASAGALFGAALAWLSVFGVAENRVVAIAARQAIDVFPAEDQVIAFTPYASIHNYELWILPKRHLDNITALSAKERARWAKVMERALKAIGELGLSYNYYFHQVIYDRDQHFYMKITPRRGVWAGVEIGSGIIINPTPPEDAAAFYRKFFR